MSSLQSDPKQEARRALNALSREEQRELARELELHDKSHLYLLGLPIESFIVGADTQSRIVILGIFGMIIALVTALAIYSAHFSSPGSDHLLSLITTIVGYLAGVLTPKPTSTAGKP